MVSDVLPGGPADSVGLKIGDVVAEVDGRPIVTLAQFHILLILRSLEDSLQVTVLRGSDRLSLQIPVIPQKDDLDKLVDLADAEKNMIPKLGILGLQIDENIARMLPGLRLASGVVVAALTASGASQGTGLQPGDIIHSFNRIPIVTVAALRSALERQKPGSPVVLQVERDGQLQYVPFEMD
jgi:serine protease Do